MYANPTQRTRPTDRLLYLFAHEFTISPSNPVYAMEHGLTNKEVGDVYRTYGHLLLRRCLLILRDESLAEDAMHMAFIKIMRYGKALREAASKLGWLYRVCDRCCFDIIDQRKRKGNVREPVDQAGPHPAVRLEVRQEVLKFLNKLGKKERQIAILAFLDGMSQEQIAKESGWSRQTINKKLKQIRQRAEKHLGTGDRRNSR